MSAHNDIQSQMQAYLAENEKFEKGNSAAGTRARKALGELAKAVKARRGEITETKNARKAEKEQAAVKKAPAKAPAKTAKTKAA